MSSDGSTLSQVQYAAIVHSHDWIRSIDPYASLSRGWEQIFREMLQALDYVVARLSMDYPNIRAVDWSTKSKFGSLRVYCRLCGVLSPAAVWPILRAPIEVAEERSARTCEICGAPGRLRDVDEWLSTRCDVHAADGCP